MTTIFITEKPSQAKEVAEALGIYHKSEGVYRHGNTVVCHAVGHIIEQAEPQAYGDQYAQWSLDTLPCLPNPWQVNIKTSAKAVYSVLKNWIKQADHVVIATDADREGEVIAREILDHVKYKGSIERLWVQETTPSGYKKGFDKLQDGHAFANLYQSGLGRAHADWVSGMNLTRALTCAFSAGGKGNTLHFGRVQTPTLALIVRREFAIARFKPTDYYLIHCYAYFDQQLVKMALKLEERWTDKEGRISEHETAGNTP